MNADDIAVRLDVICVDAAVQDRQRCAAVLQSKEWATGLLPPQDVVTITRLARGLASGSVLEFANKEMLADAINGRQRF